MPRKTNAQSHNNTQVTDAFPIKISITFAQPSTYIDPYDKCTFKATKQIANNHRTDQSSFNSKTK